MAQYAVLIYERETPGGVADIPPEVMEAHEHLPQRIAELGGRVVAGLATARSSRPRRRWPVSSCSRRATSTTSSPWPS
jgi:hypothetical protein